MRRDYLIRTSKVGFFVILALILVTTFIFYIGSKQQSFGTKKEITVIFKNVSGLKPGNAIRFSGVTIGAIDKIEIISDTSIMVTLSINEEDSKFIKKDSKVSISTEGLLGSKYIRISPGSPDTGSISDKDHLASIEPIDFDELLNVITESGNNFKNITGNVDQIVTKINSGEGVLGTMLSDPGMDEIVTKMVNNFTATGNNSRVLTSKMIDAIDTLQTVGENTVRISEEIKEFTQKLNNDSSTLGKFITDTAMAHQMNATMLEMKTTAEDVKETSTQVRNSWIVKLFTKKNKKKK